MTLSGLLLLSFRCVIIIPT